MNDPDDQDTKVIRPSGQVAGLERLPFLKPSPKPLASVATSPLTPEKRYRRIDVLGTGGMGEVVEVEDLHLKRIVAMKILKLPWEAISLRFVSEAQATAQLQHPQIVPVHDMGRMADGRWFFTMPKITGVELKDLIADVHAASKVRWRPTPTGWSLRRLVYALASVSGAVAYAHDKGVTHRDIKPSNIMVGRFGEILLLDWGIARIRSLGDEALEDQVRTVRDEVRGFTTHGGEALGTPGFMAPEQAAGELEEIGPRTDVFGLGSVLYAILTGHGPFRGKRAVRDCLVGPPKPPVSPGAKAPPRLVDLCMKACAHAPEDRFRSATAFGEALQGWLDRDLMR